jgi:hypothetical protein
MAPGRCSASWGLIDRVAPGHCGRHRVPAPRRFAHPVTQAPGRLGRAALRDPPLNPGGHSFSRAASKKLAPQARNWRCEGNARRFVASHARRLVLRGSREPSQTLRVTWVRASWTPSASAEPHRRPCLRRSAGASPVRRRWAHGCTPGARRVHAGYTRVRFGYAPGWPGRTPGALWAQDALIWTRGEYTRARNEN